MPENNPPATAVSTGNASPAGDRTSASYAAAAPATPPADPDGQPRALGATGNALPIALALQGGSSWGAYTWGAIDALLAREDLSVDAISGTSAGALNGAVLASALACGPAAQARAALEAYWRDLSGRPGPANSPFGALGVLVERYGLTAWREAGPSPYLANPLGLNPLRDLIAAHVDIEAIRARRTPPLYVTATDARTGLPRVFGPEEMSVDVLAASACLPQLFQAVPIDGAHYWDGGYSGNPSIWPLIRHAPRARDVVLIQLEPITHDDVARSAARIRQRITDITFNSSLAVEMAGIHALRVALQPVQPQLPVVQARFHRIDPPPGRVRNDGGDEFDRSWRWLSHLHRQGLDAGTRFLAQHGADLGARSSLDLGAAFVDRHHPDGGLASIGRP